MQLKKAIELNLFPLFLLSLFFNLHKKKYCDIKPVSPFKEEYFVNETHEAQGRKSILYYFTVNTNYDRSNILDALKIFTKKNFSDSSTSTPLVMYNYYKYEKGKVDENFENDFLSESHNIGIIGNPLFSFEWNNGKFSYIIEYLKKGKEILLDSAGTKIKTNTTIELREIQSN